MSQTVNCDICGAPATVHLTQILNNKIQKADFCEKCAQAKGVMAPDGFALAHFNEFKEPKTKESKKSAHKSQLKCPRCNLTVQDFKKEGHLGCMECYEVFHDFIKPILKDVQYGIKHVGKTPKQNPATPKKLQKRLKELEGSLLLAVKEERFEDAARFRDNIEEIKGYIGLTASTPSKS